MKKIAFAFFLFCLLQSFGQPKLKLSKTVLNFDTLFYGEGTKDTIYIKNVGNKDLKFKGNSWKHSGAPEVYCWFGAWDPIHPGDSVALPLGIQRYCYVSGKIDKQVKISIPSNDSLHRFITFRVKAFIRKEVDSTKMDTLERMGIPDFFPRTVLGLKPIDKKKPGYYIERNPIYRIISGEGYKKNGKREGEYRMYDYGGGTRIFYYNRGIETGVYAEYRDDFNLNTSESPGKDSNFYYRQYKEKTGELIKIIFNEKNLSIDYFPNRKKRAVVQYNDKNEIVSEIYWNSKGAVISKKEHEEDIERENNEY
ncbi:MAG: hypothetical protein IAF38_18065 [Bacteroidia bacterium]|nr:hypothetical protein [Bacteroidia bacterium]